MRISSCGGWIVRTAFLGVTLSLSAMAQNASVVRSGSFELGGFLGSSYGIDKYRFMGGANLTYAATKYILPYVEYSYFPGIGRQETGTFASTGRPFTLTWSTPLSDFHGGVHIRIPIRESRVVPYGVFGMGMIHSPKVNVDAQFADANGSRTQRIERPASTNFAVNYGGGLRFYLSPRFGMRTEAKVYKPTNQFTNYFGKVEVGFFYQFR